MKFIYVFIIYCSIAMANGVEFKDLPQDTLNEIYDRVAPEVMLNLSLADTKRYKELNPRWKNFVEEKFGRKYVEKIKDPYNNFLLEGAQEKEYENLDFRKLFLRFENILKNNKEYFEKNLYFREGPFNKILIGIRLEKKNIHEQLDIFNEANLKFAKFLNSNFFRVNFIEAFLQNADFSNSSFTTVSFRGSDLDSAILRGTKMIACSFVDANLEKADFTGSTLRWCVFNVAKLTDAIFTGAMITGCYLLKDINDINSEKIPLTIDYLKEQGAKWDEKNPPKFK